MLAEDRVVKMGSKDCSEVEKHHGTVLEKYRMGPIVTVGTTNLSLAVAPVRGPKAGVGSNLPVCSQRLPALAVIFQVPPQPQEDYASG